MTSPTSAPWALITGASSGFGQDFARQLAARGYHLILVARRREAMETLAAEISRQHPQCATVVEAMDLAQPGAALHLKQTLDQRGIAVDLLINNAGYGLFGAFLERPLEQTLDMIQLDIATLTEFTHLFAADMKQRGKGHVLQIASIGAYQATPTYAAYSAAKAYVLLFGEALHDELKPHGVTVTVLSPGISATGFLQASGQKATLYQRMFMMQSADVVRIGLRALFAGRASIIPGLLNTVVAWSNRLMPRILQRKIAYLVMKN